MTIRTPTELDAAAIASLCGELGYPATEVHLRERLRVVLASPADLAVVAVADEGQVVGWLQAHASSILESGLRAEIVGLVVSSAHRRGGLGRQLVAAAEAWARAIPVPTITVRSNIARTESHRFYPSLGYVETKTQKVYRKVLGAGTGIRRPS